MGNDKYSWRHHKIPHKPLDGNVGQGFSKKIHTVNNLFISLFILKFIQTWYAKIQILIAFLHLYIVVELYSPDLPWVNKGL